MSFFAAVIPILYASPASAAVTDLRINEVQPGEDWVEIYNVADTDTALDGTYLRNTLALTNVPLSGTLPAHGFLRVSVRLADSGGVAYINLTTGSGGLDHAEWDTLPDTTTSYGRCRDGRGDVWLASPGSFYTTLKATPGASNVCDRDGDGLTDADEEDKYGSSPTNANTDGDCMGDAVEVAGVVVRQRVVRKKGKKRIGLVHTDPAAADTDGDGLTDCAEIDGTKLGSRVVARDPDGGLMRYRIGLRRSDPTRADTDRDGLTDRQEVRGTKFRGERKKSDPAHWDTDRGGVSDGAEVMAHSNPIDVRSGPKQPGPSRTSG